MPASRALAALIAPTLALGLAVTGAAGAAALPAGTGGSGPVRSDATLPVLSLAVLAAAPTATRTPGTSGTGEATGEEGALVEVDLLSEVEVLSEVGAADTEAPSAPGTEALAAPRTETQAEPAPQAPAAPGTEAPSDADQDTAPGGTTVLDEVLPTDGAPVVGLAWDPEGPDRPTAEIRFGTGGSWSPWALVEMEETDDAEAGAEPLAAEMSESMVAAGADRVQIRITGLDRAPLRSARLVLVDAGPGLELPGPGSVVARPVPAVAQPFPGSVRTAGTSRVPTFIPRSRWNADESVARDGCERPGYASRMDRFVVHHTAGSNSYSAADSASIIRGIQRFHRDGRGWCDIGYNVLVDKYGQVFEGRAGGLDRLVVGVHASGHNTGTVGLSVLGDYTQVNPSEAAISALVDVMGWKSYLHGIDPATSAEKDGRVLRRVIGHREVQATACPGRLQDRLDEMAQRARTLMLGYQPAFEQVRGTDGATVLTPAVVSAVVPVPASWRVTFRDDAGRVIGERTGTATQRTTLQASFPLAVDGLVQPGTYTADLSARSTNGKDFTARTSVRVTEPTNLTPVERPGVLVLAGTTARGDGAVLDLVGAGLPRGEVAAAVLRVCSPGSADVRVSPAGFTGNGLWLRTDDFPDGCGWVTVGAGVEQAVEVARQAGSHEVVVDLQGYLPAPAPGVPFWDVDPTLPFVQDIGWLAAQGISTGDAEGTFRPSARVSRQAMAAFLHRAAGAPAFTPPSRPTFVDVPVGHPFFAEVEWLAAEGIATGTDLGGGRSAFKPSDGVSRQAMAAFLHRAYDGVGGTGSARSFSDVPDSSPFATEIRWLASTGVTTGYNDGTFRPRDRVSRQAMAAFLHRADGLPGSIGGR